MAGPGEGLGEAMRVAYPELDAVREAAGEGHVFLVGGAVRDLLLGRGRADIDLVVEGDAAALAAKLGGDPVEHQRFSTVKVDLDGHEIDIATARSESYAHPGALPDVRPAQLAEDLARRDFTINAMALPLRDQPELIDPLHGQADLKEGALRVLHDNSFVDDPTRALRAARYAARFDFAPDPHTEELLRETDLSAVSDDRREAELLRIAAEAEAPRAFELLADWGLIELRAGGVELAEKVGELLDAPPWNGIAYRDRAVLNAALGPTGGEVALAAVTPAKPSEGVELARGRGPVELILARALGAEWLDLYFGEWRTVELEVDGEDLIAAGVSQGPDLGRGLREALRRKLDGEAIGRDQELRVALDAARGADEVG